MNRPADGTMDEMKSSSHPSSEYSHSSSEEWALMIHSSNDHSEARDTVPPLPKILPSHMPSFKMLSSPIPSLELLNPSQDSHLRKSNMFAATFNLIATIVGGGVLSMPLSMAKSGLVLGTLLMIFAAIITDFSLYILCACARKTGASSYGAVARHAFGPSLEVLTTIIIFAYLFLVLVAFMVLVKGIWAPIIMTFLKYFWADIGTGERADDVVLLVAVLFTMPFFLSRDLHGLRHSCFASFASIMILCVAMIYRAWQRNVANPNLFQAKALYVTSSVPDALFSYPIIALAFVSSFNVVEVHCALVDPSRKRVRKVIHGAVFWSFVLMYIFSLAGYLYAFERTDGNILLNFAPTDEVVFVGRIGCGICTLLAMPMSLLPCRDALLAIPAQISEWKEWRALARAQQTSSLTKDRAFSPSQAKTCHSAIQTLGSSFDEENCPLLANCQSPFSPQSSNQYSSTSTLNTSTSKDTSPSSSANTSKSSSPTPQSPALAQGSANQLSLRQRAIHWGATLGILSTCFVGAVLAPGVAVVWSIVGSSLAFLVQYILPAACYIKLCHDAGKARNRVGHFRGYIVASWALLAISCAGAVACTAQTVWRIFFMEKD